MLSVLITDDNARFRSTASDVLSSSFDVIGVAPDGPTAITMVEQRQPDVVLMDIFMPDMDGVEATRRIRAVSRETNVVLISTATEAEIPHEAWGCGAIGFVTKDELTPAVLNQLLQDKTTP